MISQNEGNKDSQNGKEDEVAGPKAQLIQEEEREKGSVGFPIYWKYITAAYGGALVPLILLAQILFQILQIGSNYWMAWATPVSKDMKPAVSGYTLITVYVCLAIGSSFCILARATLLVTAGYKTATLLFNKMHLCIFRAPMSFFDATPSGRILNRASTDQSAVETQIPSQVGALAFSSIQLLGIIAVMSQRYYIPSARELSRLVGVCKTPVIQHFAETISGAATIRSFDQQSRFQETNMKVTDAFSRPKFHFVAAMEWLCFHLDMFSSFTFAFSLVFLVSFQKRIDPAIAGLAVTYGLNLNTLQAWVIWNLCNCENKIISVERILQYMSIPSEPPLIIEASRPNRSWPSHGEVEINNLQVRYAPQMPLVLRGLTCTFPGGMKTGIVGRTGSGKSTLIQTLFRIVEPVAGRIMIDDIDISSIGLHDLRSRLSIIPQDPTMFEGTVRSNLDPLEEYTDEQIWEALDKCQLGDEVRKKERKLDSTVIENGENWSMGQRQLVCLGRVLLKKSKVLVLDEATASVDTSTDNLIQQTLRQHFSDCTVITIAHRVTSVLDSDMVLLLSHGLLEEYDSPARLLENKASSFAQLVAEYRILFQVLQIGSNYWMAWAAPVSKDVKPVVSASTLIVVYVLFSIRSSVCILARATLHAAAGYKTTTLLFNKMHLCIFRAPLSFFDATSSGRIINRVSTDQSAVETRIPYLIGALAFSVIQLLGIIAVMSQVAWQVFIVFIPMIAACIWYQRYYISSARELSRLVGIPRKKYESYRCISRTKFHIAGGMEWLCFRLDMFSSVTFAFSLAFLVSVRSSIDPAIAGLAVTYGLNLNMLQASVIWNLCDCENKIISVERIIQYVSIPSEPPLVVEANRPGRSWPSHGEVRDAPQLPLVLRCLTCTLPGGKKTSIVGRTGSGKSTLIQTLFRIVEPVVGRFMIDDIDISLIGLHDLRSRLKH
ncbi:hypothetical protein SADUNF_Sadunf16G0236900 [Salix dunnii]|uniref:ABC-type xenobiotic transporter n=1 Tax=Salix dunnii TaxID=1413687 RepID=A0A835JCX0_9ROSI|nr:hypothetical protein SADUNF_Sadunf16G0236900 [Salix dunnii]